MFLKKKLLRKIGPRIPSFGRRFLSNQKTSQAVKIGPRFCTSSKHQFCTPNFNFESLSQQKLNQIYQICLVSVVGLGIREGSFTNDCPKFGERIWTVDSFFFFINEFSILYRPDEFQDTNFAPTCKVLRVGLLSTC